MRVYNMAEKLENLGIQSVQIFMEKVKKMIPRVKLRDYTLQQIGGVPMCYVGSQAECLHGLHSDSDIMYESQTIHTVSNVDQATYLRDVAQDHPFDAIVILDRLDTHAGYTKVKLFDVNHEAGEFKSDVKSLCQEGSSYLSNVLVSKYWKYRIVQEGFFPSHGIKKGLKPNGPCIRFKYTDDEQSSRSTDIDSVFSLKCDWLEKEWFSRQRNHRWPTEDLMNRIKSLGCNIVPIGHTNSLQRNIEWRISFTKAERELIWSFNGTQYACVDFMKIFFHAMIVPKCPDVFPSYFIKTAMFWMVEESPADMWRPENLCQCLEELLRRLVVCVGKKEVLNYFIPANNMLDTKPDTELEKLLIELEKYQQLGPEKWKRVMKVRIDEADDNDIYFHHVNINSFSTVRHYTLNLLSTTDGKEFRRNVNHIERKMECAVSQDLSKDVCKLFLREINHIRELYEALCLNLEKSRDEIAMERMVSGNYHLGFCSRKLLSATVNLFLGKFDKAKNNTEELIRGYNKNIVHYSFHSRDKKPNDADYELKLQRPSLEETLKNFIALDVVCLPSLKPLYPGAIQDVLQKTKVVLFIHPLFYANLIKFHCCVAIGDGLKEEKLGALQQLKVLAEKDSNVNLDLLISFCSEL